MKVVFACAGSGGHVNPAIAIAKIILKYEPNSRFLFIGTKNGLENKLVKNAGFDIAHISTGKLLRSLSPKNITAVVKNLKGIKEAKNIISSFAPDVVIGTGGYICGPVMLASRSLKIPYILHESNAFPGVSVKLLAKHAKYVLVGFDDAKKRLKRKDNVVYTGTPAKFTVEEFEKIDKNLAKKNLMLNTNKKIVLVTCGSQGAKKINETVVDMVLQNPSDKYFIVLVTGDATYEEIRKRLNDNNKNKIDLDKHIKLEKFVFDMDKMYKACDMCVTRAGAMTITELSIAGKPSILIPLPTAAENHQLYNAKVLEAVSAGKIILQNELTTKYLDKCINDIISSNLIDSMSINARKIVIPNVDENIYSCISKVR